MSTPQDFMERFSRPFHCISGFDIIIMFIKRITMGSHFLLTLRSNITISCERKECAVYKVSGNIIEYKPLGKEKDDLIVCAKILKRSD